MVATTVAIMGSTGSIGTQTLEVIEDHPDEFEVVALGGGFFVSKSRGKATIGTAEKASPRSK